MKNSQLILQAIEYIESKLKQPLSVLDLSRETGYSLFHFIRLFQGVTGLTPGDYIARRRISEAARDILSSPGRTCHEISLDYAYNDYETFTRAFKRLLHTTPTQIRHKSNPDIPLLLHPLQPADLPHWSDQKGASPDLIELGKIRLQGPFITVTQDQSVIGSAWEQLFHSLSAIPDRKLPEQYYQVGYWPDNYENQGISFHIACELNSLASVRTGTTVQSSCELTGTKLTTHTLPPARYLRFKHTGPSAEVSATYKYIYGVFLPRTDYRLNLSYEFEYYGQDYLGPHHPDSVSEIYIPLTLL
ncbi:helix-turn-helix domain-containing protein [Paenibacillus sp. FSL R7-0179]|uniref:helix-turn-helix domain-containing protein n=1 Tax=Paenibacillus sp. FSL R7-0179 TaxID=2921672 RepID=UPI0030F52C23